MATTSTATQYRRGTRGNDTTGTNWAVWILVISAVVIIGLILWAVVAAGNNDEIPVVGVDNFPAILAGETGALAADDRVQVLGRVRMFNIVDVENEIGYDLDDGLYSDWEGEPVIVASAVDRTVINSGYYGNGSVYGDGFGQGDQGRLVTIDDIEDDPSLYVGDWVVVSGDIEDLIGTRGFVLEEP